MRSVRRTIAASVVTAAGLLVPAASAAEPLPHKICETVDGHTVCVIYLDGQPAITADGGSSPTS